MFKFFKKLALKNEAFTLIELLVSVAIIAIVTAVVIFNQSDLSEQISLNNVVSDISLVTRQAQVYGISVKQFTPLAGVPTFSLAYGVDFNIGTGGNNAGFYTFADSDSNGYFNSTCPGSECVYNNAITRGNTILQLCVIPLSGLANTDCSLKRVAITFLRPNPSARIIFFNSSNVQTLYNGYLGAKIVIKAPHGMIKTIVIYTTGQISIQ